MSQSRGPTWGPLPLPEFLTSQLAAHGFAPGDASKCAADLRSVNGRAATASLFVDLGSCKFLEGDIDGAVASWRQAITSTHDAAAARALLNMGLMYEHLHLFPRAITVLSSVADRAVAPHEVPGALALARCQREAGEADQATETVALLAASTMANRPHTTELAEILLALGDLAHGADRPDRAERSWRLAVAGPDSSARRVAASKLVQLSLEQGRDDEFIELLATDDAAQAIAAVVLDRANGLVRLGHDDRANELLATVDERVLTTTERFRLADLRIHLGQVNEGIDQFEVLLGSHVPEVWQRAAFALGSVYLDYEMPDVAGEMFDRVRTHQDRYWAGKAALVRGDLYSIAGDDERAMALWAEASKSEVAEVRAVARDRQTVGLTVESLSQSDHDAEQPTDSADGEAVANNSAGSGADDDAVANNSAGSGADRDADANNSAVADNEAESVQSHHDAHRIGGPNGQSQVVNLSTLQTDTDVAPEVVDLGVLEAEIQAEPEVVDLSVLEAQHEAKPETAAEAGGQLIRALDADRHALANNDATSAEVVGVVTADGDISSEPPSLSPPVIVELEPLDFASLDAGESALSTPEPADAPTSVFARLSDLDQPVELSDEIGSYADHGLREAADDAAQDNPYAALAPEGYAPPPVSTANPYAALAPSADEADFTPAEDVEPGDWQSLLEEWPAEPQPEASRGLLRKRPSAFSRYTT